MKTIVLFFLIYIAFSINYSAKTLNLIKYLKKNEIYNILENGKPILVVNTRGCGNCIKKNLKTTEKLKNNYDLNLIILGKNYINPNVVSNAYIDSLSKFNNFNISPYYDCLIKVENEKIIEITELNFELDYKRIANLLE